MEQFGLQQLRKLYEGNQPFSMEYFPIISMGYAVVVGQKVQITNSGKVYLKRNIILNKEGEVK